MTAAGARPIGAEDEAGAARAVRQMFDSIAPRYDLLNHLLSPMWIACGGGAPRGDLPQCWRGLTLPCWTFAAARAT